MDGIEQTFAILGGGGFALLVLSLVLGEIFEFGDHDVDFGGDADHSAVSWFSTKLLGVGMVGLGGFGYLAASYGAPAPLAWLTAILAFFAVAFGTFFLVLKPLSRQEANSLLNKESYVGREGKVSLTIPAEGVGQIVFRDQNGGRVVTQAVSSDERAIPSDTLIYIVAVTRDAVMVMPSGQSEIDKE